MSLPLKNVDFHPPFELESLEAEVWTQILQSAPAWAQASAAQHDGFVFLQAKNLAPTLFNRAIWIDRTPVTSHAVTCAISRIAETHSRRCMLQIRPSLLSDAAVETLRAARWEQRDSWVKTCRPTDGLLIAAGNAATPACPFNIVQIDASKRVDFGRAAAAGFGMPDNFIDWFAALVGAPGWRHFVAYARRGIADVPAAAGALYIQGAWAWLGVGATAPEFRRQGAQYALIAARLAAARREGCAHACTETGKEPPGKINHSLNNMRRAGFQTAYLRPNFHPPE